MLCRICKKEITLTELSEKKAVIHDSFGAACLSHKGVEEHYEELTRTGDEKNEDSRAAS